MQIVRTYSQLSKARLSALVLVTAAAGFLAATPRGTPLNWKLFLGTMAGTGLAAASAAMWNQLLEKRQDALMKRTVNRPLPSGAVGTLHVLVVATILAFASWTVLLATSTTAAALLAVGNIVLYAAIYTPLKSRSTMNTVVGSVCGAIPPLIGWVAARGDFSGGGWTLAMLLFVWQFPHFFALGWMYREDYARGGFRILPVLDPDGAVTGMTMLSTSLLLIPSVLISTLEGVAGFWYAGIGVTASVWMCWRAFAFFRTRTDADARSLFFASLAYLPIVLTVLVLDRGPVSVLAEWRGSGAVVREIQLTPPPTENAKPNG